VGEGEKLRAIQQVNYSSSSLFLLFRNRCRYRCYRIIDQSICSKSWNSWREFLPNPIMSITGILVTTQALAAVERGITTAVQYPHPVGVWPHDVLVITCTRLYVSDTYIRLSVDLRTARLTMSELSRYYLGGSGRCFSIPSFHLHSPFTPLALAFHLRYPAASSVYRTKEARARVREREREREREARSEARVF